MKYQSIITPSTVTLPLVIGLVFAHMASAETVTLDDGTTCTVIESSEADKGDTSSSVTAGGGSVTSSTTVNGKTTTLHSQSGSTSSSAGSSSSSTGAGAQAFSSASVTQPDGSVVTRRSDGSCDITKPDE